jgi:hypothetical protein
LLLVQPHGIDLSCFTTRESFFFMASLSRVRFFWVTAFGLAMASAGGAQPATPYVPEDFSNAALSTSHLIATPPELVERDEEPEYISEWVTVSWRPDDPIYLYVVRPAKIRKPPVVIYLYDYPSETDVFQDDDWCRRATAGGYAAVGFVPALTGHRYHGRPMKEWFVSELQEALAKSSHDVQMVMNYLEERGDIDTSQVGMFGVGAGATIGVIAASADARIKAVDLINPWGDWPVWLAKSTVVPEGERPLFLQADFLKRVAGFDPVVLLPKLKAQKVRLVQAMAPAVPEEARHHIAAALPAKAVNSRPTEGGQSDEFTSSEHALEWIKLQLKVGSTDAEAHNSRDVRFSRRKAEQPAK